MAILGDTHVNVLVVWVLAFAVALGVCVTIVAIGRRRSDVDPGSHTSRTDAQRERELEESTRAEKLHGDANRPGPPQLLP